MIKRKMRYSSILRSLNILTLTMAATSALAIDPVSMTASDDDGNVPENTYDNDLGTRWSAKGDGVWIRYDFGTQVSLEAMDISFYKGNARQASFEIQNSSDGSSWSILVDTSSSGTTLAQETYPLNDANGRYFRIVGYGNTSNTWTSVTEVDFIESGIQPPPSPTPSPTPSPSIIPTPTATPPVSDITVTASADDGNAVENLLDENFNTRWSADGDGQWAEFDLGFPTDIGGLNIAFYKGNQRSATFDIQTSNDGDSWTTELSQIESSGDTNNFQTFEFEKTNARFIRYLGFGNSANSWNSLTEVEVLQCNNYDCILPPCEADPNGDACQCEIDPNHLPDCACILDPTGASCLCSIDPDSTDCACASDPSGADCLCGINPGSPECICAQDPNSVECLKLCDRSENPDCPYWWPVPIPLPNIPEPLDPTLPPNANFDLGDWYLSVPEDLDNSGKPDDIKEEFLWEGYSHPDFFYMVPDDRFGAGLVFKCPIRGPLTPNTDYARTELREMLRRGEKDHATQGVIPNNWVLSTSPSADQSATGFVDGKLSATLKVDRVTTTGSSSQVGRVIVGQIHASSNEPLRIYYRKLPGNALGSIYFAHEPNSGSEQWYEMIGSRSSSASNPGDGVALGEVFSYDVEVVGNGLTVTISRDGKPDETQFVDMSSSGYDDGDEYFYFKAGAYNQNDSGNDDDYVQVTFYKLENAHTGYDFNQ